MSCACVVAEWRFAWLGRDWRHSKDYEWFPESREAWITISAIGAMLRRLAPEQERKPVPWRHRRGAGETW